MKSAYRQVIASPGERFLWALAVDLPLTLARQSPVDRLRAESAFPLDKPKASVLLRHQPRPSPGRSELLTGTNPQPITRAVTKSRTFWTNSMFILHRTFLQPVYKKTLFRALYPDGAQATPT